MSIQLCIPFVPPEAQRVNSMLAISRQSKRLLYIAAGVPIFSHEEGDEEAERVILGQIVGLGLAKKTELAMAVGRHRNTIARHESTLASEGVAGLRTRKPGPKAPHKLRGRRLAHAQSLLEQGLSIRETARRVGVTHPTILHALGQGRLRKPEEQPGSGLAGPAERAQEDLLSQAGVAVRRHTERMLASAGQLAEALPRFEPAEGVRHVGVLLALPALLSLGLLQVGERVYQPLRNGFYGLRSMLLVLAVMALLRIRSPERLQYEAPGELGRLLGLDRVPEVKTLRRKLSEMAEQEQALAFARGLAEHWVEQTQEFLGFLYVDGHVRAYHGEKHSLPKAYVARRRLAMPAVTDFWVNDTRSDPLFWITSPTNDSLVSILEGELLPQIREMVGERRVTVVFDRGGWSPDLFRKMVGWGFDVLTYRKGKQEPWPEENFLVYRGVIDGREVEYELGERSVWVKKGFWMREIRRRREEHQTAILTTRQDLDALELAYRMFSRWRQENFFRYMRQHYALDDLLTYAARPADPDRLVPNQERRKLEGERRRLQIQRKKLLAEYGEKARQATGGGNPAEQHRAGLERELGEMEAGIEVLTTQIRELPGRVPLKERMPEDEIVELESERKDLSNVLKMIAYRAETGLVSVLAPHYERSEEEGRALVREMLCANGDLLPNQELGILTVRFYTLANPRANQALRQVCQTLNETGTTFPGTNLRLVYEAPDAS
jgi:transposase-like protein